MTARLLPFFLLAFSASVYGQVQKQAWLLKWDATAVTDPLTPAALYSIEIPIAERWSLEAGYGMPLYYLNGNKEEQEYQEFRAELHWLMPAKPRFRFVWGLELFHIPRRYAYTSNYYQASDGQEYFFDYARLTRNATGLCLKGGGRVPFGERFLFEFFAGLGARHTDVQYYDVLNPSTTSSGPFFIANGGSLFDRDYTEGKKVLAHAAIGIKFGIALNAPAAETDKLDNPKKKKKRPGRRKRH